MQLRRESIICNRSCADPKRAGIFPRIFYASGYLCIRIRINTER